jgi:hypothetical protein
MESDFHEHFDEELDIITNSLWGSEDRDKLELLRRRAYYCATTPRNEEFKSWLCPTDEEIEWVSNELSQTTNRRRLGRLISILKYAYRPENIPSLARFLRGPSESLACEVLWIFNGLDAISEYAHDFIALMRGLPWDDLGSCQRLAIDCVGEYLHSHSDPRLLRELVNIYESDMFPESVRSETLYAFRHVAGVNDLTDDEVVERAKERLMREEGTSQTLDSA